MDSANVLAAVPTEGVRKTEYNFFVQYQYKLRPNITISLGLRYDYFGVFSEVHGRDLPFEHDLAMSFNSGVAAFQKGSKWGFLRKDGSVALEPTWEKTGEFSEGVCPVKSNGRWGLIDPSGKVVMAPRYQEMDSFTDGLVAAKQGDQSIYLDHGAKMVWRQKMDCPAGSAPGNYKKPS